MHGVSGGAGSGASAGADDTLGCERVFCELDHLANPVFALPYFQPTQLVRSERWKLMYYPRAHSGLLYDLQEDPGETVNRYGDTGCREIRDELIMDLLDHHHEAKDPLPLRLSQA